MKKILSSTFNAYRKYRNFTKTNKTYKAVSYSLITIMGIYCLILIFPQFLFAHEVSYKNFNVYSRQPLGENLSRVLDSAEARLTKSRFTTKICRKTFLLPTRTAFINF
jgi:hypothetical protein